MSGCTGDCNQGRTCTCTTTCSTTWINRAPAFGTVPPQLDGPYRPGARDDSLAGFKLRNRVQSSRWRVLVSIAAIVIAAAGVAWSLWA